MSLKDSVAQLRADREVAKGWEGLIARQDYSAVGLSLLAVFPRAKTARPVLCVAANKKGAAPGFACEEACDGLERGLFDLDVLLGQAIRGDLEKITPILIQLRVREQHLEVMRQFDALLATAPAAVGGKSKRKSAAASSSSGDGGKGPKRTERSNGIEREGRERKGWGDS